jgi:hypothetical protein
MGAATRATLARTEEHHVLSMSKYTPEYVAGCRRLVDQQLASYDALATAADAGGDALDAAVADFEPRFGASMLLALDQLFVHRARAAEGKDGNPLNEVRVLCRSIMENDGVMVADNGIKLDPARSVLGLAVGDRIEPSAADVARMADAFLAEIERRFV